MRHCLFISFILAVIGSVACADRVVMLDGHILEGKIISNSDPLRLRMVDDIRVSIPASRIKSSIEQRSVLDDYNTRREGVSDQDIQGLLVLASWCHKNGLVGERVRLLQSVLKLDFRPRC